MIGLIQIEKVTSLIADRFRSPMLKSLHQINTKIRVNLTQVVKIIINKNLMKDTIRIIIISN